MGDDEWWAMGDGWSMIGDGRGGCMMMGDDV